MLIYLDGEVVLSDSDPGESADDLSDDELIADKIKVLLEEYMIYILESDLVWFIHRVKGILIELTITNQSLTFKTSTNYLLNLFFMF